MRILLLLASACSSFDVGIKDAGDTDTASDEQAEITVINESQETLESVYLSSSNGTSSLLIEGLDDGVGSSAQAPAGTYEWFAYGASACARSGGFSVDAGGTHTWTVSALDGTGTAPGTDESAECEVAG